MNTKAVSGFVIFLLLVLIFGCSEESATPTGPGPDLNNPPVIEEQADTFATVGQLLAFQVLASDADGDTLEYSAIVHATWTEIMDGYVPIIEMNGETGVCHFTPSDDDIPERSITFIVDDHNGGLDSTTFVVTVNERSS